jgi:hypothetical protein
MHARPCTSGFRAGHAELLAGTTCFESTHAPGEIRTPDLRFRRAALYPAELQALVQIGPCDPRPLPCDEPTISGGGVLPKARSPRSLGREQQVSRAVCRRVR